MNLFENYNVQIANFSVKGVIINNTNSFFILRNFSLYTPYSDGIYLHNVQNGLFENNTFLSCSTGFNIENSSLNQFSNNTLDISRYGFYFSYSFSNIIVNNNLTIGSDGFSLYYSSYNNFTNNYIYYQSYQGEFQDGFYISYSPNNNFIKNTLVNNNFILRGPAKSLLYQQTLANNTINGRPLVFLQEKSNLTIIPNAAQVIILDCNLIKIRGLNISNGLPIAVFFSSNTMISNSILNNGDRAVYIQNSVSTSVLNNKIGTNNVGLSIINSTYSLVQNNYFNNNYQIAEVFYSNFNSWRDNQFVSADPYHATGGQVIRLTQGVDLTNSNDSLFDNNTCVFCEYFSLVVSSSNIQFTNNDVINATDFVYVFRSNNINFVHNSISDFLDLAFAVLYSNNCTIMDNSITFVTYRDYYTSYIYKGMSLNASTSLLIENNTILNSNSAIQINDLFNSSIITNTINKALSGIYINNSNENTFSENTISSSTDGIVINNSFNNAFFKNVILNNLNNGFTTLNSTLNTFDSNNASNNGELGFLLKNSDANIFTNNSVANNDLGGLVLNDSNLNTLFWNNITFNHGYGATLYNSTKNTIYLNSFNFNGNSSSQAFSNLPNTWSNGTYGNYWSDYNGSDTNNDQIGDTPYIIAGTGNNSDAEPLMNQPQIVLGSKTESPNTSTIISPPITTVIGSSSTHSTNTSSLLGNINIEQSLTVISVAIVLGSVGFVSFAYLDYKKKRIINPESVKKSSFLDYLQRKFKKNNTKKKSIPHVSDDTFQELEEMIKETNSNH